MDGREGRREAGGGRQEKGAGSGNGGGKKREEEAKGGGVARRAGKRDLGGRGGRMCGIAAGTAVTLLLLFAACLCGIATGTAWKAHAAYPRRT